MRWGVQVVLDLLDALEELLHHATFTGVGGHKVEDEAVLFLAVPMDAPHPLLQTDGVPRDVVVDHQPTELQVDAFAGRLCGDKLLGAVAVAEYPLGVEAGAGHVAVADLHAAVDLRDVQAPLRELIDEVVQRVFMLGEDQ